MKKNGAYFFSVIASPELRSGVWDPYAYRAQVQTETLQHFASVEKLTARSFRVSAFKYAPIEYRHLHRGLMPVFTLESCSRDGGERVPVVPESTVLFGTMRAYLGNVLVTPRASWIGEKPPAFFPVKSEFVQIVPKDGLNYFWWAFLQSQRFLQNLPIGSWGTRPRLDKELLLRTPVEVPLRPSREKIHSVLSDFARNAWQGYIQADKIVGSTIR
jgi:hypothetical protein